MNGSDDDDATLQALARDISWICHTLARMETSLSQLEERVRLLETRAGPDRRAQGISLGVGSVVGAVVAWLSHVFGGQ